ncbi:MAG: response regulator transcription factor [Chthoniobacterales bacterium]
MHNKSGGSQKTKAVTTAVHRILLADGTPIFLSGLSRMIRDIPDISLVGSVSDSRTLLKKVLSERPDFLIAGHVLSDQRTLHDILPQIVESCPNLKVLAFLPSSLVGFADRLQKRGARWILPRDADPSELAELFGKLLNFGTHSSELPFPRSKRIANGRLKLSDREFQILTLIAHRRTYKEIADLLGISTKTVNSHRQNIKAKTKTTTASELLSIAENFTMFLDGGLKGIRKRGTK